MGMYTELVCAFNLKEETPTEVIGILERMCDGDIQDLNLIELPDHNLFKSARWKFMLKSDSYYFDGDSHSTIRNDSIGGYYVTIRCNLKNYDDEIEKFIDWVKPYISYGGNGDYFIGYSRYEESKEPTLIYV